MNWLDDEDSGSIFPIAVPGIKIAGWWPNGVPELSAFDQLSDLWPTGTATFLTQLEIGPDEIGRERHAYSYIRILEYPSDWVGVLERSMLFFAERGAAIVWAGGWECFLHYEADTDFAGCCVAYTRKTGFVGSLELDTDSQYIDDPQVIARLHAAVQSSSF